MKLNYTLAVLAATTLASQAATTIIDTTTNSYSTEDRGRFALTNTGQTFTTGALGVDTNLSSIQLQQPRDYTTATAGNSSGDNMTLQIWTDTDGDHSTWDPGVLLGTSSNAVVFDTALAISDFAFTGVTLADATVYTIAFVSDDASADTSLRIAVTKNAASPGASGSYKEGTLFDNANQPFSNGWDSGFSVNTDSVPEPSSTALLGLGGLALLLRRRK